MILREEGRIQLLPLHLVNQIAAGEVIERPASVVKELLENAIDAGATEIRIELEEGGKRLIRVTDDGMGIAPSELPLAVASHATSKLRSEADLHRIHTLGFRGEALASIASVSELDLLSRQAGQEAGERILARDGTVSEGLPESIAPGTRITVRNLFYNVPARRRFLRGERSELARIHSMVKEHAIAMPTVGFTVSHGGKISLRYPAGQPHRTRIAEVLGRELAERLISLPPSDRLLGWIAPPDVHRRTAEGLHVFLNGRPIRDRVVFHAVREGFRGHQIPGHHPVAVIFLDLPPESIDVNVHPTKEEVRFEDSSVVHTLVRRAVREALAGAASVPPLDAVIRDPNVEPRGVAEPMADRVSESFGFGTATLDLPRPLASPSTPVVRSTLIDDREVRAFQVRSAFIVVEEEDGLVLIDQHALHEKILYEEILASRDQGIAAQVLLVPEPVELDPAEWQEFVEAREALRELGFEVDEFGDSVALVRSVPAGFESRSVDRLLRDVLARLAEGRRGGSDDLPDLRERLLQTLACKRAVKAGQPLSAEAISDLVRGRARAFQPRNCPHGRPAELRIGWEELNRRFDRK